MGKLQTILRQKVLEYRGKKILKDWNSAKQFVGKTVRITIGHPSINPITKKFEEGHVVGTTQIKLGEKGATLAAVIPDHGYKGYSIGYAFKESDEQGSFKGENYDAKRYLDDIDHIALVNDPRDPGLLADSLSFATDSFTDGKSYVNIYPELELGIDSYYFPIGLDDNTTVDVIYMGDDDNVSELKKIRQEIDSLKAENAKFKADNTTLREKLKTSIINEVKNDMDRLENIHNFNPEVFKGKKADFIKGALFAADSLRDQYGHALADELGDDSPDQDASEEISLHNLVLDGDGNLQFGK